MGGCRFEGPLTAQRVVAVLGEAVGNVAAVASLAEAGEAGLYGSAVA